MADKDFFDIDIFKIRTNNVAPKTGRILIADPFASDFFFTRSVVLLTEYNSNDGAMGFILNKPVSLENIPPEILEEFGEQISSRVFHGGPVGRDQLFYIHQLPPTVLEGSLQILPNLFWGGDFKKLAELIKDQVIPTSSVKFFIGYSGWAPGQLEKEISNNYWVITNISPAEVLGDTSNIWKEKLRSLGPKYEIWTHYPLDPQYN